MNFDYKIDQIDKEKVLRMSLLSFYNYCGFQFCFKLIFIFWPSDHWMIQGSYEKTIGLVDGVFMMISMIVYFTMIFMVYKKLKDIKEHSIALEIRSNLKHIIIIALLGIFFFVFGVFGNLFWNQINSLTKYFIYRAIIFFFHGLIGNIGPMILMLRYLFNLVLNGNEEDLDSITSELFASIRRRSSIIK